MELKAQQHEALARNAETAARDLEKWLKIVKWIWPFAILLIFGGGMERGDQTSQIFTPCASDATLSRVGMNSWPT